MIFIDAREGISGDMLLAAMLGLLPEKDRAEAVSRLRSACGDRGMEFRLDAVTDGEDRGWAVSCTTREPFSGETGYSEAHAAVEDACRRLGSGRDTAVRILGLVFDAESKAHGLPAEQVHLHEVGRPQALMNICGIGHAAELLAVSGSGPFEYSVVTTGRGIVVVSHGVIRIPAPACTHLLEGVRHQPGDSPGERATPTGIAALKGVAQAQTDGPPRTPAARSIGFGTKRFGGRLGRVTLYRA